MAKMLKSIFTDDMDRCIVTGMTSHIERHHIFGAFNRNRSEKYNFIAPLHSSVHPNGAFCNDLNWTELDHFLKRMGQMNYEMYIGTREEWLEEFGRYYDDRDNEGVWLNEFVDDFKEYWDEIHD